MTDENGDGPGRRTRAASAVQATERHATPPLTPPSAICECGVRHRWWRTVATCARPWAEYASGDGPWVYVHKFRVAGRIREHLELHPTQREAYAAKRECPCSGTCASAMRAGRRSFYLDLRERLEVAA